MIHNTNVKRRSRRYAGELRGQQAEATRVRILEALVRTMANGVAGLSVPAVAREAGVSIPTIYRHFGSKQGLVDALNPYVLAQSRLVPDPLPESLAEFKPMARDLFRNLDGMDLTLRAAMASELGQQLRRTTMPRRRGIIRTIIGRFAPDLPEHERDRVADMLLILMATPTFHAYRDYLELGPDAAADFVDWALGTMIEGARSRARDTEERQ